MHPVLTNPHHTLHGLGGWAGHTIGVLVLGTALSARLAVVQVSAGQDFAARTCCHIGLLLAAFSFAARDSTAAVQATRLWATAFWCPLMSNPAKTTEDCGGQDNCDCSGWLGVHAHRFCGAGMFRFCCLKHMQDAVL